VKKDFQGLYATESGKKKKNCSDWTFSLAELLSMKWDNAFVLVVHV
jgi:hypothetical protein